MKLRSLKLFKKLIALAPVVALMSAQVTCVWMAHQSEIPEEVKNMKKSLK
ncbi:cyclic lactone autoinducer peptide [Clostridioides mangenotii]|nr:cyclic lactone autoinducer peptide [Clostridioides mangenotii]MBU5307690.1 cyclic lactone autoinducer peptide [Clostridioides mangenotii]